MCEIAVIDPDEVPIEAAHQIAATFHEEQGDGLGVLAVHHDGDKFRYETHKSTKPHWQTFFTFFQRNYERAWRFVIHGRAKTSGNVNRETSHPIEIDCGECDFDYVVHNGHVRKYSDHQDTLEENDHTLSTDVDSEVIAHKIGELPDTIEDHSLSTYKFRGNLNYLVFSENGILVRVDGKYHLTDNFTATCSLEKFSDDPEDLGFEEGNQNEWMLVAPSSDGEPEIETKDRTVYRSRRYSGNSSSGSANTYRNDSHTSAAPSQDDVMDQNSYNAGGDEGGETYTVVYNDHSNYDHVAAIKVAPGVMKVIDKSDNEASYVFRDHEPKLYYWYAPEEAPDNIGKLEELAEVKNTGTGDQQSLDDFPEEMVTNAVAEEVTRTVATVADVQGEKLRDIHEEVKEAAEMGTESALEAGQSS